MPVLTIKPPLNAPTHNRRASDHPEPPALTDLAEGEFHTAAMAPGCRSISFSLTGHEHPIDPERLTVDCATCKLALETVARGESARELTIEISPEVYRLLDGEGGRVGMRPAEFAAKLLEEWRPAR